MKVMKLLGSASLIAVVASSSAYADQVMGDFGNNSNLILRMNNDGTSNEGLVLQDVPNGVRTFATIFNNGAKFSGTIEDINDNTVNIGENLDVNGSAQIHGTTTVTSGGLNVTGATDLNTGLNVDGQTMLDATTIVGATSITGTTSIAGVTSVNTSNASNTTIGGASNITSVLSSAVNLGTGNYATQVRIGSSSTDGTDVFIGGGRDVGDTVAISSGATRVFESVVELDGAGNFTNEVDIRAKLVGGWDPIANPGGAELADITLDADDDVNIRTGDDLEVSARSKIQLDANDNIELDTNNNVEVVADNDIDMSATRILGTTGNASSVMQNGSIMNTVTASEGVAAGSVIANNGAVRMVADENGKIVVAEATDTTTGTTASMYVTNSAGNLHGLVVQETKTTLSGGTNSGSMTLDDRGATFSNPVDGSPIQVHGVADGTAPFDAVNVRQLYSGLAAVLASTPEIALAPGKTGMALGLGGYGTYGAIGIGFGHMYEDGTTLKASASKGQYSELAYRASISWNW